MKKSIQHISVMCLLILYSLLVTIQPLHASEIQHSFSDLQTTQLTDNFDDEKTFHHTLPAAVDSVHQLALKLLYPVFINFYPAAYNTIAALPICFQQYNFYSQNLIQRLKNTDLIFPFHYFL